MTFQQDKCHRIATARGKKATVIKSACLTANMMHLAGERKVSGPSVVKPLKQICLRLRSDSAAWIYPGNRRKKARFFKRAS